MIVVGVDWCPSVLVGEVLVADEDAVEPGVDELVGQPTCSCGCPASVGHVGAATTAELVLVGCVGGESPPTV
jgi:hypothetical protein